MLLPHRRLFALAAASLMASAALPTMAEADWRYGRRHHGGDVALGILGGVAAGALIAGAVRPPLVYDELPPPPRAYRPRPVYIYEEPRCYWTRQKIWLDSWTYQVRRVQVCD
jgi:hypothetical protein